MYVLETTKEEMNKEAEIWEEVIQDNALDEYVAFGGSVTKILANVRHDICFNYCKYGEEWKAATDDEEVDIPEVCQKCPFDKLGDI